MNISDRDLDSARRERGTSSFEGDAAPGAGSTRPGGGSTDSRSSDSGGTGGVAEAAGLPKVDQLVDEVMPEEIDWQRLVRSYPVPALLLAAAGGFFLGMRRGPMVVSALSGWAAGEMTRRVNEIIGDDVF